MIYYYLITYVKNCYYLYNSYVTSDKYLLLEKGYTIDEVSFALTNKEIVNTLLKKDYNKKRMCTMANLIISF